MLDVTGKERKKVAEPEVVKKLQYDWSYENSINVGGELIDVDDPHSHKYSQWRTNSALASHQDTIAKAMEMNLNAHLSDKLHYHYLYYSVRKRKRFAKKLQLDKPSKDEHELIELIADLYKYNYVRAKEVLRILTKEQLNIIKKNKKR